MLKDLKIVECHEKYWDFVRELRNNPIVQEGFIEKANISKENQIIYMKKNSHNYRICLKSNVPVGYFGVLDNDIRICTSPKYQNQGIGKFMLKELKKIWPGAVAKVKVQNNASKALFLKSGYFETFIILENEDIKGN